MSTVIRITNYEEYVCFEFFYRSMIDSKISVDNTFDAKDSLNVRLLKSKGMK